MTPAPASCTEGAHPARQIGPVGSPWNAKAAGLGILTLCFALGATAMSTAAVSLRAWLVLYALCVAVAAVIWAARPELARATTWLVAASYAALFAAIFYGANLALDALQGPHRNDGSVAHHLEGLELWFVLCPGMVSVAWGSWLHTVMRGRCRAAKAPDTPALAHDTPGSSNTLQQAVQTTAELRVTRVDRFNGPA